MSTDPHERIKDWKRVEGCTHGEILQSNLTYDEAARLEKEEAKKGCRQSGGGPRKAGRVWSVYYLSGCK